MLYAGAFTTGDQIQTFSTSKNQRANLSGKKHSFDHAILTSLVVLFDSLIEYNAGERTHGSAKQ